MAASAGAVLVVGAQGSLGSAIAQTFENEGWEVLRGGRRPDGQPGFRLVDLDRPETLESAIAGMDVVVDPVPHPGLTAERAVLRDGGILIDVSMRPAAAGRLLRQEADDPRGTVVLNAGRTPGVSNLVVAELLQAHPEADEVEMAFSFNASGVSGRAAGENLHRYLTSAAQHGTAVIPFPSPVGPTRCLRFAESEEGWLSGLARHRAVSTYARFSPAGLNRLLLVANALRLMSTLPLAAFIPRRVRPPGELSTEPLLEWIAVLRNGQRLAASTITGHGNYRVTASATLALAETLTNPAHRDRLHRGCLDPQDFFTLAELRARLQQGGLLVDRVV